MKKTKLMKYCSIILTTGFIIVGCDPQSTPSPSQKSASYLYKGMLVGSSGHITITVTSKSSDNKGTGEVTLTMDSTEYTLTPTDDKVANFEPGSSLDDVHFANENEDSTTFSLDKDGEMTSVSVSLANHDDPIGVAMFKEHGEDVEVYEGLYSSYLSEDHQGQENLVEQSTFNLIIKGNDVKLMQKKFRVTDNACVSQEDIDKAGQEMPQELNGRLEIAGDNYKFNFSIPGADGNHDAMFIFEKDSETTLVGSVKSTSPICSATEKELDPDKAYTFDYNGETVTGYKLKGGEMVSCHASTEGAQGSCQPVPEGGILIDEDGNEIAPGDARYYRSVEVTKDVYNSYKLTKVL